MTQALPAGTATTDEALALFDRLEPVPAEGLLGAWAGRSFPTGHPLDGALEAFHWHGKRFDGPEHVHPLVFDASGGGTVCVNPALVAPALPLVTRVPRLKSKAIGRLAQACLPLLATRRSRGRLRMLAYRGVTSGALVYDQLPIIDVFRRADADTVLGLMDRKGMARPFFFVLRRE